MHGLSPFDVGIKTPSTVMARIARIIFPAPHSGAKHSWLPRKRSGLLQIEFLYSVAIQLAFLGPNPLTFGADEGNPAPRLRFTPGRLAAGCNANSWQRSVNDGGFYVLAVMLLFWCTVVSIWRSLIACVWDYIETLTLTGWFRMVCNEGELCVKDSTVCVCVC